MGTSPIGHQHMEHPPRRALPNRAPPHDAPPRGASAHWVSPRMNAWMIKERSTNLWGKLRAD
eukprot:2959693-Pyramimonas_sp.AAC.1